MRRRSNKMSTTRREALRQISAVSAGLLLPGVSAVALADGAELAARPAGERALSRVAFGACHKLDRPFDVWDSILGLKPELFIFLGDTVYLDTVDMEAKRAEYAKLAAVPNFANFRKHVPIVATWDRSEEHTSELQSLTN